MHVLPADMDRAYRAGELVTSAHDDDATRTTASTGFGASWGRVAAEPVPDDAKRDKGSDIERSVA